ncbi:MAG: hypothetical protein JXA57_21000 [Armatimonadetes bacterium]|nr:hypothetical protein [Armatimonadota bacterium]
MWTRQEFLDLASRDVLTFGVAVGEQVDALATAMADDERILGFLVNLVFDETTGERTEWLVHLLTEKTLMYFAADHAGATDSKRFSPGAFASVSTRSLGLERDPADGEALHSIRGTEVCADFSVGGGYLLFSGSQWYDQWGGNVTDVAIEGAAAFLANLPRLA